QAPHPAPLPPPVAPPPAQQPPPPQQPGAAQPVPGAAAVPVGAPRPERESMVALFLVHMFPIGHLPVASDRPARHFSPQDRTPGAAGPDGASGTADVYGFPPLDHPESATVDTTLEACGDTRRPAPPPVDVLPPPPAALFVDHDPLGGRHERDWDAQYLTADGDPPGYVWPPPGRYPEGGCEPGEPVVLAEGTLIDRFGTAHGRVFAPDGTPFAHRSLPPAHRDAGYRRYRVLRDLPVWRAVSAPWFGQPGGGVRYRTVYSAAELVTLGRLADITFEQAPGNDTEGEHG
ncbi:TNT domain-containing protein, partial [Saccharomonospora iraqiensis]|uniref:TNT domain-containing protein n=1 Tax=Saccharomonospora iraqiensis TaxID=52698 RepID=UPI0012B636DF